MLYCQLCNRSGCQAYFLNKLSNAARASFAVFGAAASFPRSDFATLGPPGCESRATVTLGEKEDIGSPGP